MKCSDARKIISEVVDGEVDSSVESDFFKHMSECDNCNNEYMEIKNICDAVRNIPDVELPENLHRNIIEKVNDIAQAENKKHIFSKLKLKGFMGTASAAIIILAFLLPTYFSQNEFYEKPYSKNENSAISKNNVVDTEKSSYEFQPANSYNEESQNLRKGKTVVNSEDVADVVINCDDLDKQKELIFGTIGKLEKFNVGIKNIEQSNNEIRIFVSAPVGLKDYVVVAVETPERITGEPMDEYSVEDMCIINILLSEE